MVIACLFRMAEQPEMGEPVVPESEVSAFEAGQRQELVPEHQYLLFRTGNEHYSLSVLDVEEVVEWIDLTPIPLAPPYIMGVFNLRGAIVPALDIAYGEKQRESTPKHLVVTSWDGDAGRTIRVGLGADEVLGTCQYSTLAMAEEASTKGPHCRGMLQYADGYALALDLSRLAEKFPMPGI